MKQSIYEEVTAAILEEIDNGAAPWLARWENGGAPSGLPSNAATGNHYNGINTLSLWMAGHRGGYKSDQWVTFLQAKKLGGTVRKGEKGSPIIFYKMLETKEEGSQEAGKLIPMAKRSSVFNIEQCDGLELKADKVSEQINPDQRSAKLDQMIAAAGADIREIPSQRAFFATQSDYIVMPEFSQFYDASKFYATAFHELAHWTQTKPRLDRPKMHKGKKGYAFEELVAELSSAFLCAKHGVVGDLRHADYIEGWADILREDSRAIFKAASLAQKAADYLTEAMQPQAVAA